MNRGAKSDLHSPEQKDKIERSGRVEQLKNVKVLELLKIDTMFD